MKILISTAGIVSEKFPKAGLRDIIKAGYDTVVLHEIEDPADRDRVLKICESTGLNVMSTDDLLTNQTKILGGHHVRGEYCNGIEAANAVDALSTETGKNELGPRLKMVTITDNDGNQEASMLPFTAVFEGRSRTDWLSLIRGLREIEFDGALVIKLADTAAAFSPIIRPALLKFSKTVAEYIAWQINIESVIKRHKTRVLFGAGNMCRAYMKCYGEKFPPLFTCDNNKKLWNTNFCALEVKSPDSLKEIPEDCAIFICNVYYSEIERQLREMGLNNPIERFNDEYLPSFYFDRI